MKRVFSRMACAVAIAIGAYISPAEAEIQTYKFTWSVNSLYVAVGSDPRVFTNPTTVTTLSGDISIGQTVYGIVSFDNASNGITYPNVDGYKFFDHPATSITLQAEGSNFSFRSKQNGSFRVGNLPSNAHLFAVDAGSYNASNGEFEGASFGRITDTADYGSLEIPSFEDLLNYRDFTMSYGSILADGTGIGFIATTRALSNLSKVPEPSSHALLIAGLGCLGWSAYRRTRAKPQGSSLG